jgi:hypothetical protein
VDLSGGPDEEGGEKEDIVDTLTEAQEKENNLAIATQVFEDAGGGADGVQAVLDTLKENDLTVADLADLTGLNETDINAFIGTTLGDGADVVDTLLNGGKWEDTGAGGYEEIVGSRTAVVDPEPPEPPVVDPEPPEPPVVDPEPPEPPVVDPEPPEPPEEPPEEPPVPPEEPPEPPDEPPEEPPEPPEEPPEPPEEPPEPPEEPPEPPEPPVIEEEPPEEPEEEPVVEEEPVIPEIPEELMGLTGYKTKPGGVVDIDYLYDIGGESIFAPDMQGEDEEDILAYLYSNLGDSDIVQDYDIEELIRLLESQRG